MDSDTPFSCARAGDIRRAIGTNTGSTPNLVAERAASASGNDELIAAAKTVWTFGGVGRLLGAPSFTSAGWESDATLRRRRSAPAIARSQPHAHARASWSAIRHERGVGRLL